MLGFTWFWTMAKEARVDVGLRRRVLLWSMLSMRYGSHHVCYSPQNAHTPSHALMQAWNFRTKLSRGTPPKLGVLVACGRSNGQWQEVRIHTTIGRIGGVFKFNAINEVYQHSYRPRHNTHDPLIYMVQYWSCKLTWVYLCHHGCQRVHGQ